MLDLMLMYPSLSYGLGPSGFRFGARSSVVVVVVDVCVVVVDVVEVIVVLVVDVRVVVVDVVVVVVGALHISMNV